jgi:hypothetical protein
MSIQTTISDYHNNGNKEIKLSEIKEDYFGIYIKLIRGTFDQYENNNSIPKNQSDFLAQHELNIKIIDAFRDSISWLIKKSVLTFTDFELKALLKDLAGLFTDDVICNSFDDLNQLIKKEQKEVHIYFREKTFEKEYIYIREMLLTPVSLLLVYQKYSENIFAMIKRTLD